MLYYVSLPVLKPILGPFGLREADIFGFVFLIQCTDIIGDRGLREVGSRCTKLRRLVVQQDEAGFVTQHGLTAVAEGCFLLEKVIIYAADMTNAALETLANNCPGLSDIRICLVQKYHDSHPVSLIPPSITPFRTSFVHIQQNLMNFRLYMW